LTQNQLKEIKLPTERRNCMKNNVKACNCQNCQLAPESYLQAKCVKKATRGWFKTKLRTVKILF